MGRGALGGGADPGGAPAEAPNHGGRAGEEDARRTAGHAPPDGRVSLRPTVIRAQSWLHQAAPVFVDRGGGSVQVADVLLLSSLAIKLEISRRIRNPRGIARQSGPNASSSTGDFGTWVGFYC